MDRRKPKRLRSLNSDHRLGVYEIDSRFVLDLNTRPVRRAMPAMHAWLATAPQQRKPSEEETDKKRLREIDAEDRTGPKMPFLQEFFKDLRRHKHSDTNVLNSAADNSNQDDSSDKCSGCHLDQYSNSLTHGHHKRFKELLTMFGYKQNTFAASNVQRLKKKEFRTICDLFRQERKLYGQALREFWNKNGDRFHLGFKVQCAASHFVGIKSQYVDIYRNGWLESGRATKYGPCIQTVSMRQHNSKASDSDGIAQITTETYAPKVVFRRLVSGALPVMSVNGITEIFKEGNYVQALKNTKEHFSEDLLCEDNDAKRLAIEHDVQVVLTDQVAESLLKSSQWILPISHQQLRSEESGRKMAVFIDRPLPSSSLSRECLSFGMISSLQSQISQYPRKEFVYTVMKIVRFGTSFNILVRTECFALNENKGPLHIDVSLEYFPGRGIEMMSAGERATWLFHKILHSDCRQILLRIDPQTGKILNVAEKGVADAISSQDETALERNSNSLYDFEAVDKTSTDTLIESMMDILFASTKLANDCEKLNLLCFPGRHDPSTATATSMGVSVHKESSQACCVDLEQEFDNSKQVFLKPSFRRWVWDNERTIYTFPCQGEIIPTTK
eukprot:scaffold10559_cov267-Chaetoceros_neogracile.AAC.17